MTKRMLIDATHAEETRVVVLDGSRLDDFDVETSTKKQLKGNIYLAKVVRVEPSLQAAFVEYGGNRHGFLAFGEIHPDYYQIPVADRQRLMELQEAEARAEEEAEERAAAGEAGKPDGAARHLAEAAEDPGAPPAEAPPYETASFEGEVPAEPEAAAETAPQAEVAAQESPAPEGLTDESGREIETVPSDAPPPEVIGGEGDPGEERERRLMSRHLRHYKIQEVIRRRQILLVQVVKEERGTKGAALTTYISLAGRFSVLMPNSPRGGGVSRKITSAADRKRLREAMSELDIPRGMGLIVRTAGANRPKPEIKRDCEYLLRLWDDIREKTMQSVAPALINEEASLIKRAIRDVYSRDIEEILVDGEAGWRAARDFMRMLMPSHARKVILWKDPSAAGAQSLFARQQVEAQLDAMLSPNVQLKSGGYLVINQTEALVAIDVNSGRSTRERGIEETALRTNLEAADEAARQLRLRDLAGLIVIDFIDMEAKKHNAMVERRLKDALKVDRARIQVGHISHFGLMEMSRQRLRPSLAETSFVLCPHCGGVGHVRSTESAAMHVLRAIEEEGAKRRAAEIVVHVAGAIAMYILNHKRAWLAEIEARHFMQIAFNVDDTLLPPQIRIDKLRPQLPPEELIAAQPAARLAPPAPVEEPPEAEAVEEDAVEAPADAAEEARADESGDERRPGETSEEAERRRRRRRRRRRGSRRDEPGTPLELDAEQPDIVFPDGVPEPRALPEEAVVATPGPAVQSLPEAAPAAPPAETDAHPSAAPAEAAEDAEGPARRRGRRGGRRRRPVAGEEAPAEPVAPPAYVGPTPADPFAGHTFDIFDVLEQHEARLAAAPAIPLPPATDMPPATEAAPTSDAAVAPAQVEEEPPEAPPPDTRPKPVLVGSEDLAVEKKRGWWRR